MRGGRCAAGACHADLPGLLAQHSRDSHGTLAVTISASAGRGERGAGEHRDERKA